jgi:MoxR-like ATPase
VVDGERKGRIKEALTIKPKLYMKPSSMKEAFQEAQKQVSKVFLGHPDVVQLMFIALLSEGHILIDDRPGLGKTTLAKAMASVMTLSFQRIQFTADLLPSDILGTNIIAKAEAGVQAGFRFHSPCG